MVEGLESQSELIPQSGAATIIGELIVEGPLFMLG
jgi:hypothetical protein